MRDAAGKPGEWRLLNLKRESNADFSDEVKMNREKLSEEWDGDNDNENDNNKRVDNQNGDERENGFTRRVCRSSVNPSCRVHPIVKQASLLFLLPCFPPDPYPAHPAILTRWQSQVIYSYPSARNQYFLS